MKKIRVFITSVVFFRSLFVAYMRDSKKLRTPRKKKRNFANSPAPTPAAAPSSSTPSPSPPNVVMKWIGHSDYKAMKPCIDIVDSIKASEMTKLNGLL